MHGMRVTSNVASSWQPTTSRSSRSRQTRPFRGPGGLRQEYEKWANGLPDGEVDIKNAVGGDEWVAFECVIKGTNTGPFVTPVGEIAPTGRTVKVPFSTFLQIRGGKVAKVRHYYDIASLMSQLGISPEVMAGATA
jgi:predicted ester cyclase